MNIIKKIRKNEEGFTLLETSIVLLIIAVLSLLIIPNVTGVKDTVDGSTDDAIVASVEAQILLYEMNHPGKSHEGDDDFIGTYVTPEQYKVYENSRNK